MKTKYYLNGEIVKTKEDSEIEKAFNIIFIKGIRYVVEKMVANCDNGEWLQSVYLKKCVPLNYHTSIIDLPEW